MLLASVNLLGVNRPESCALFWFVPGSGTPNGQRLVRSGCDLGDAVTVVRLPTCERWRCRRRSPCPDLLVGRQQIASPPRAPLLGATPPSTNHHVTTPGFARIAASTLTTSARSSRQPHRGTRRREVIAGALTRPRSVQCHTPRGLPVLSDRIALLDPSPGPSPR
jgi:hypothetical protein